jgi:hypothetical protein
MISIAPETIAWKPEPRAQPDVARQVDGVGRGLQRVAEHHVADVGGRHAGFFQRALRREHPQVGGGEVLEGSAEGPHSRALGREEDDVCILALRSHLVSRVQR